MDLNDDSEIKKAMATDNDKNDNEKNSQEKKQAIEKGEVTPEASSRQSKSLPTVRPR